jgi:hypothetical protein
MAQAVSCQPPTTEARVRSRVSLCGICGGQSGTGAGFSPSTSVFLRQFHSTSALLHEKNEKLIIFITQLHNKSHVCGAFVASAAGPLKTGIMNFKIITSIYSKYIQLSNLNFAERKEIIFFI